MDQWLTELAANAPYLVIWGILLLTGFGLPLPEDIPLILAGYLAGQQMANPWIMFPGAFLAILGSDAIVYTIGRRYGYHVPRLPVLRRFITEDRLATTERLIHTHGGKFIFMARFLPGLRTPAFFTAGTFKIPFWKFLLFDGSAAILSVPLILGLAYYFADEIDQVRQWAHEAQLAAALIAVVAIALFLLIKRLVRRRIARVLGETGAKR